jgi:fumarate reductase flavoprotein subunit
VAGVTARTEDREIRIATRAVIIATGGFGANHQLLEKYFPGHSDVFTLNRAEMTGDGLQMAEGLDAEIDDNMVLLVTGPHHYPWSHVLTLLVRRPDIVLVNKTGERYCDETIFLDYHTEAGNALSRQPDKMCYCLLDSSIRDHIMTSGEIVSGMEREAGGSGAWVADLDTELEAGVTRNTVAKGASWEEVARLIGADPGTLSDTVLRYNAACAQGRDDEFFKERKFLLPLRTPPFYAVLGRQGFDTTLGGIKVDRRMQVIDRAGSPIVGLYATGDCASGWEHENYNLRHPGSAMTFALCSGYIAGREAAAYIGLREP